MIDQILRLPLSALRESPFNPRKHYPDESTLDMAESIRAQGVLQPVVVRPLPEAQQDLQIHYELVFGHRRYRGSQMAKMEDIPAIVREMTDEQAALAQVHENIQREDMTAVEEADAFMRLHTELKVSAPQLAENVGKSLSYVYGRLKMARLCDTVRAACTAQGLPPEIALEIARLGNHDLQRKALEEVRAREWVDGQMKPVDGAWISSRDAKRKLRALFVNDIADAPWDPADAALAKVAGACTTCPRRAGNDPDLTDVLEPGICTDAGCWSTKEKAHRQRQIDQLRKAGHEVIEGEAAAQLLPQRWSDPAGLVPLRAPAYDHQVNGETCSANFDHALRELGKKAPKARYIVNPHSGDLQAYIDVSQARSVLRQLGKAPSEDLVLNGDDDDAGDLATLRAERDRASILDRTQGWTDAERVFVDPDARQRVRQAVIERIIRTPRTTDELRLVLLREHDMGGDFGYAGMVLGLDAAERAARDAAEVDDAEFDPRDWYRTQFASMTADQLAALLVALAVDDALSTTPSLHNKHGRELATANVALVERYGVDVLSAARGPGEPSASAEVPSTPSAAAQAKEEATGKAKAGVAYRCPATGSTWSGRGMQPAWVKAALANGKTLAELAAPAAPAKGGGKVKAKAKGQPKAGPAGQKQTDDAGSAGERDAKDGDLFGGRR